MPICRWRMPVIALLAVAPPAWAAIGCEAQSGTHVVPLVELYTAEGCNSCPPADRWLSSLARQADPTQLTVLAFHVDYWDDEGWRDRFADPRYTERQRARVTWAKGKTVYTPQVMVGEQTNVGWSNSGRMGKLLAGARAKPAPVDLLLRLAVDDKTLRVGIKANRKPVSAVDDGQALVWLALYRNGLTTAVRAGENKGAVLHHDRVVGELKGPWALGDKPAIGELELPIPADADPKQLGLALFAESASGAGLQSLNLPLSACLP